MARLHSVPHGTTVFGIPFGISVGLGMSPFIIMLGAPLAEGPVETSVDRQLHSQLPTVTRTDSAIFILSILLNAFHGISSTLLKTNIES